MRSSSILPRARRTTGDDRPARVAAWALGRLPRDSECVLGLLWVLAFAPARTEAQTETIRVDLKLRTGGVLTGPVVEHTDHGLVVVSDGTPYVFAWEELESDSACAVTHALTAFDRGGEANLTGEDHFRLGQFSLRHGQRGFAVKSFRQAERLDPSFGPATKEALAGYRREQGARDGENLDLVDRTVESADSGVSGSGLATLIENALTSPPTPALVPPSSPDVRQQVLQVYRQFGEKVREVIGEDVVLVESPHFLIWTDWEPRHRNRLVDWCESMYGALSEAFGLDPGDSVFIAKCPVFCWRSKARFRRFAQYFDGYDGSQAVGYTRSIEANGHVHVVLLRQGRSPADFDRFAYTLVHEGTHAFVHRLYSSRLIPHWVNEGLAELMSERILGDRCPAGENAALLARQFVRYDWPVQNLLQDSGPIEVHQYSLAYSFAALLEASGSGCFAGFIRDLKEGRTLTDALAARYDGLTLEELEARWRSSVRQSDPRSSARPADTAVLPWATEK